ncbi:hypothetical protein [Microvirga aerophila]|uniref:Uncharacterized protein n=1 Tax=Microvirga aerophila TaxID=670291 RepID=A0A512BPF0_9HYPH|nr:hypothetical protein [Microvirga aerophila]GEO13747.1 hypothetical protein MAE02_14430 [Microvirga aerophila]
MNRILLVLGALVAGALLIPDVAEAQRGGRGGGGARIGGGGFGGGGGGFRGGGYGGGFRGGGYGGGSRMYIPRGGMGGSRIGMGGSVRGGAVAARPGRGDFRQAAINNPGRFVNRGEWRGRYPYYGGRYPNYGRYYGRYPYYGNYYGGWGAGLATGAVIGAAATYPYYNYPYATYQTPVASADGGYCVTAVRTCTLTSSAPIGTGCSCRVQGGRARGTVQ